ncbi:NAD(P)-dependent alcohol dehydrogenase [Fluviicola sp.]|uniref:NAD(P)-dependent alcohol dehydrogenase n=1 Tax=Fluviicola sp. TaxID=1917219 RepID=UPI00260894BD|nr:NAD(P)-dependent alcohol dehydrogenase [Fluviicola sp.]
MKAIVYHTYGAPEVLQFQEIEKPIPKANEVLVKVHASTVTAGTIWVRKGEFPESRLFTFLLRLMNGFKQPQKQVIGFEFSGIIESAGVNVSKFKKGDPVYGTTTDLKQGAYAEYVCVPESWKQGVITRKPDFLSFEEAAALPIGAMTAYHILQKKSIQKGAKVLVYGASGSVGSYAVQLAKFKGAHVTALCSAPNLDLVKSLGADKVIDYRTTDLSQFDKHFDVVFDAVGKLPSSKGKSLLQQGGKWCSVKSMTSEKTSYLNEFHQMISDGKLKPVIDRTYPLEEIVEAHRYVESGRKRGNVVILINGK